MANVNARRVEEILTSGITAGHYVAGSNITITENQDGTETIASTGGGGGGGFTPTETQLAAMNSGITEAKVTGYDALPDDEDVKDLIADHFVAGTNITITDNADGTQTIASSGGGSSVVKFTPILEGVDVADISQLRSADYSEGLFVCQGSALNGSGGFIYVFAHRFSNTNYVQYLVGSNGATQCQVHNSGLWKSTSVMIPSVRKVEDPFKAVTPSITGATITNIGGGFMCTGSANDWGGAEDKSALGNICFVNIWFDIDDASLLDGQDLGIYAPRIKSYAPSTNVCTTLQMTAIGTNTDSKGVCYVQENGKLIAGYNSFSGSVRICISGSYIVKSQ